MAAEATENQSELGKATCGAGEGGCCQCQQVIRQLNCEQGASERVPIKEVLLVFFVPLICAAGVVIWAVRSWPGLAARPWYLALTALGTACGAIIIAKVLTGKKAEDSKNKNDC